MAVLHYGLLGFLENWQLCFIFDGLLCLKLFNVDVRLLYDSQTLSLMLTVNDVKYVSDR